MEWKRRNSTKFLKNNIHNFSNQTKYIKILTKIISQRKRNGSIGIFSNNV